MLRCSDISAELDAYLDGELEEERASEVAAHLEACPACADALAERRRVSLALKHLPAVHAPENFMTRFSAARKSQPSPMAQGARRSRGRLAWAAGSVAAAAAALLATATLLPRRGNENITRAQPDAPAVTAKPTGRSKRVTTPAVAALEEKAGAVTNMPPPRKPMLKVAPPAPATARTPHRSVPSDASDSAEAPMPAPSPAPARQPFAKLPIKDEAAELKSDRSPEVRVLVVRVSTAHRARKAEGGGGLGYRKARDELRNAPPTARELNLQGTTAQDAESRLTKVATSLGGGRLDAVGKRDEPETVAARSFGTGSVSAAGAPTPGGGSKGAVAAKPRPVAGGKSSKTMAPTRSKGKTVTVPSGSADKKGQAGRRRLVLYIPADQVKTFEKALGYWSGKETARRSSVGVEQDAGDKDIPRDRDALLKQLEKLNATVTARERSKGRNAEAGSRRYVLLIIELSDGSEPGTTGK